MKLTKVTRASHGYDGYLGICVGHPTLIKDDGSNLPPADGESEESDEGSLLAVIQKAADEGNNMTAKDILAVWTANRPKEITVAVGDERSQVSSITTGSPSVSVLCCAGLDIT